MKKPHLACDADMDKVPNEMIGLPKIDGVRMLHITDKATGRSLKAHANKHITNKYSDPKYAWLDGELTFGDIRGDSLCRDTTSVVNRISGEPDVVWNVFDYIPPKLESSSYEDRYIALIDKVKELNDPSVVVVPIHLLSGKANMENFYQECLDQGFEGAILRKPSGKPKNGRCTAKEADYVRLKPSSDKEAKVVSLVEAQENLNEAKTNELGRTERSSHKENKVGKGMVGMLKCIDNTSGMEIDVGAGKMTHEERQYYWEHPEEIIGEFIKYRSMDVGIKSAPRFARYICKRAETDMS